MANNTNRHGLGNWGLRPRKWGILRKLAHMKFTRQSQRPGTTIHPVHRDPKVISRLRSILAFALGLWCAGAGCMMVSYARASALANSEIAVSKSPETNSEHTSGSMGSHACCKARYAKSRRQATNGGNDSWLRAVSSFQEVVLAREPTSSDAISCCPLTSGSFVIQSRSVSSSDEGSPLGPSATLSAALTGSASSFRAAPLRLVSHDKTYLTCCAFLI